MRFEQLIEQRIQDDSRNESDEVDLTDKELIVMGGDIANEMLLSNIYYSLITGKAIPVDLSATFAFFEDQLNKDILPKHQMEIVLQGFRAAAARHIDFVANGFTLEGVDPHTVFQYWDRYPL